MHLAVDRRGHGVFVQPRDRATANHGLHSRNARRAFARHPSIDTVRQVGGWSRGALLSARMEILPTARAVCDCVIELAHLYSVMASCRFILHHWQSYRLLLRIYLLQ